MAKFTIEQHEIHLDNYKFILAEKIEQLRRVQSEVYRHERKTAWLEHQIEQAKLKKKTSFDPDRFLKNERVAD